MIVALEDKFEENSSNKDESPIESSILGSVPRHLYRQISFRENGKYSYLYSSVNMEFLYAANYIAYLLSQERTKQALQLIDKLWSSFSKNDMLVQLVMHLFTKTMRNVVMRAGLMPKRELYKLKCDTLITCQVDQK